MISQGPIICSFEAAKGITYGFGTRQEPRRKKGVTRVLFERSDNVVSYLEDRETSFLLSLVRITMKQSLPEIEVGSFKFAESREGEIVEVPRWVAESLKELGFVEIQEEPFDVELFRALSRERIAGSLQLSTLRRDFYLKLRRYLESLRERVASNPQAKVELDRLGVSAYDLVTLRTAKILQIAPSSSTPDEIIEKITPEERALFDEVHNLVSSWRNSLLQGSKST